MCAGCEWILWEKLFTFCDEKFFFKLNVRIHSGAKEKGYAYLVTKERNKIHQPPFCVSYQEVIEPNFVYNPFPHLNFLLYLAREFDQGYRETKNFHWENTIWETSEFFQLLQGVSLLRGYIVTNTTENIRKFRLLSTTPPLP